MKIGRIILHGCILGLLNLAAIFAGFIVYSLLRPAPQLSVQIPVSLVFNGLGFAAWSMLGERYAKRLMPRNRSELVIAGAASLPLTAGIFMGLHYATQHYASSFDNIAMLWIYQGVVNGLLIAVWAGRDEYCGSSQGLDRVPK